MREGKIGIDKAGKKAGKEHKERKRKRRKNSAKGGDMPGEKL